ncbi:MAG: UDP-3-O-(3-hydroxymyristoyl)glucosamine N-acyltransferase [Candidatus Dadabacteria bacterium]|nr:MAG: UDP-3-O-(3-hydroxymyristoyl)glucosamine N-acyltransferase [Candidatus Dadabacteria bacterium]
MRLFELLDALELPRQGRDRDLTGAAPLDQASPSELSFFANPRYREQLSTTAAGAVFVRERHRALVPDGTDAIVCDDPYAMFARAAQLLYPERRPVWRGIADTAIVASDARLGENVSIGPGAIIGPSAAIGDGACIDAGAVIGADASIGTQAIVYANAVVADGCTVGDRTIIHSGAVIGADGFGFAPSAEGLIKIPQIGRVILGNDVEIGANTTVDRGALGDTVIEDGVKLDNLIQVGHNTRIGAHTVIAGGTVIAGSVSIGRGCMIGGQCAIAGHLSIGDGCQVAGRSGIMRDVEPGSKIGGAPAVPHAQWMRQLAAIQKLPDILRKLT